MKRVTAVESVGCTWTAKKKWKPFRNSAAGVIHSYVAKLERVFHPRSFVMRDGYSVVLERKEIYTRVRRSAHRRGTARHPRARPRVCVYTHTGAHTHVGAPEILQYVIVRLERVS